MVFFDNSAKILSLILKNIFFSSKISKYFYEKFTIKKQGTFSKTSKEKSIPKKKV